MNSWLLATAAEDGGWLPDMGLVGGLVLALILLVIALGLLFLEFFVVSGGLLSLVSLVLAVASISLAFAAHPLAGWIFVVTSPLAGFLVARWGLARLQRTSLVAQGVIDGNAGIAGTSASRGITVGSEGEMVTDAVPSGRARFPGGTADVTSKRGCLSAGDPVRIISIAGPTIFVTLVEDPPTDSPPQAPNDKE